MNIPSYSFASSGEIKRAKQNHFFTTQIYYLFRIDNGIILH